MLHEQLNSNKLIEGIEGNLTLELRDATTGKLQEQMKTHNFLSMAGVRYLKYLQRANYFKDQISVLNAPVDIDYAQAPTFDALVLTDLTASPDSASEWQMFGKLIGYSAKQNYSGIDPLLGTPNAALCDATPTYTKWVFDWASNAGNGTIGSVGWMGIQNTNTASASYGPRFYSNCSIQDSKTTVNQYLKIARASSSVYYFAISGNTIVVADGNFAQTSTFSVSTQFAGGISGIAWDNANSKLWVIGKNGSSLSTIASYNSSGTKIDGPTLITNRAYTSLTYDGTNLWTLLAGTNGGTLYKFSPAGSELTNIVFAYSTGSFPETPYALAYESTSQRLYVSTYATASSNYGGGSSINSSYASSALHAYDTSGNEVMVPVGLQAWYNGVSSQSTWLTFNAGSSGSLTDFDMLDTQQFLMPQVNNTTYTVRRVLLDGMGSRAKLPSPISKTNTQTLRITYQMDYT